jgi:hypothetical protein
MEPAAAREAIPPSRGGARGGWRRAAALLLFVVSFSLVRSSVVVVGIGYVLMAAVLPVRRWPAYTLAALTLALMFTGEREPFWWVERGWALLVAGCFVALTLRWPAAGFMSRALGAIAGSALLVTAFVVTRMGGWGMVDWQVAAHLPFGMGRMLGELLQWLLAVAERGGSPPPPELASSAAAAVEATIERQARLFPALAALGSLAGLGVSWWVYGQVALGEDEGLRPLREFRFNDHLVWLFVTGLVLVLMDAGEVTGRAGWNVLTFMGALYALRGAAVVAFFGGGSSPSGLLMLAVALLLGAPILLAAALVIGLGDTWLDPRGRARELMTDRTTGARP